MISETIDVDGSIDLVARDAASDQQTADQANRARQSRLNDVMIVLERDHAAIEQAIRIKVKDCLSGHDLQQLTLHLDQAAPRFEVTLIAKEVEETTGGPLREQTEPIEAAIADAIFLAIQSRAAHPEMPRWQPKVTATARSDIDLTSASAASSIWFKTLLWLIAAVAVMTGYLYFNSI